MFVEGFLMKFGKLAFGSPSIWTNSSHSSICEAATQTYYFPFHVSTHISFFFHSASATLSVKEENKKISQPYQTTNHLLRLTFALREQHLMRYDLHTIIRLFFSATAISVVQKTTHKTHTHWKFNASLNIFWCCCCCMLITCWWEIIFVTDFGCSRLDVQCVVHLFASCDMMWCCFAAAVLTLKNVKNIVHLHRHLVIITDQ